MVPDPLGNLGLLVLNLKVTVAGSTVTPLPGPDRVTTEPVAVTVNLCPAVPVTVNEPRATVPGEELISRVVGLAVRVLPVELTITVPVAGGGGRRCPPRPRPGR